MKTVPLRATAVAVGACALLATACSSSGGSTTPSSSASSSGSAGAAAALAAKIRTGLRGLTSAHIDADAGALGGRVTGDFRYANGSATASDLHIGATGADHAEIITVGARSWVKPPAGQTTGSKPWVLVRPDSSNAFVRSVSALTTVAKAAGSLPAVADVVATASAVADKGATSVDGVPAHEYDVEVRPGAAAASALTDLLNQVGAPTIPITLDVDQKGRPVHVAVTVALGGANYQFTVAVSKFDAPVRISAPPANQVSGG